MHALDFWKTVTMDQSHFLERLIDLLTAHDIAYCAIGGQAVNAYAEPVVSLDLDLVVAVAHLDRAVALLKANFAVKQFPIASTCIKRDRICACKFKPYARYFDFPERAEPREILGLELPVASLEDTLQRKIWAALDADRRSSKRQKDPGRHRTPHRNLPLSPVARSRGNSLKTESALRLVSAGTARPGARSQSNRGRRL